MKDKTLREKIEQDLNIILPENAELEEMPNLVNEIYNYVQNKNG
jgi:hypothetical protein